MDNDLPEQIESWLRILDESTYYELLGVLEVESAPGIRKAFHEFSMSFHPDRHRHAPPAVRAAVTQIYRRGAEAYGVLRDDEKRAVYDIGLSQGRLRYQPGLSRASGSQRPGVEGWDLSELARTKAGKLHTRQAERAIAKNRLDEAEHLLDKALLAEGENRELLKHGRALVERIRKGEILPSQ